MSASARHDGDTKFIKVASGKGGVGKTWFAVTLAQALVRAGRRVLLFDGDLGLANVDIQLGLTPEIDLGNVIAGDTDLKGAITNFEDFGVHAGRFDIIAGRSGSGALNALGGEHIQRLLSDLIATSENYDHVILDLAAGLGRDVRLLSACDGPTFVVLTADPTSLTDAYAFIKLSVMNDRMTDLRIIVNMVSDRHEGESVYEAIRKASERFLGITPPLAGIIRADTAVTNAIRRQEPLYVLSPSSDAAEDVRAVLKAFPATVHRLAG